MYPELQSNCIIKGCAENFFLLMLDTFKEYFINDFQAEALLLFNGENNINSICEKLRIDKNSLSNFLHEMDSIKAIRINTATKRKRGSISDFTKTKSPYLKEVHLDITSRCTLKCLHCYQEPYLAKNIPEMNTEQLKQLIEQLSEMNIAKLVISGGEPFLRDDLVEIIDFAFSKGIIVPTIFTNGTINDKKLDELCNYGKPFTLAISLEGYTPEMNDYIRGHSSFKNTMKFLNEILNAQKNGSQVKIVIDTTVHPMNFDKLKRMFLYLSKLGVQRWRVSLPRNQGAFRANSKKLEINLGKALAEYEKFIKWYLKKGINTSSLDIQIESFFRTALVTRKEISVFTPASCCCEYKREALAVKPNGDIVACTAFTNLVIGDIKERMVKEIWNSPEMQKVKQIKVFEIEYCKDCKYLYLCGTGCRRMALADKGIITAKDESMCEIYAFFHNRIMSLLSPFQLKLKSIL
jgi:radical SAM protein with 4Fe4S-binding SPASM domain